MARGVLQPSSVRTPSVLFLVSVLSGCRAAPYDAFAATRGDDLTASIKAAERRMHERFSSAKQMAQSIALGDLERAHDSARVIALLDEPDALPEWRPYIDDIREMARQIEFATTTIAAARSATILGLRCAHCHLAIKARVTIPLEPRPPVDQQLALQMRSHQWAAVQMWTGLIAPADDHWLAGAAALTVVPINMPPRGMLPRFADDLDDVARIRLSGRRALTTRSDADRVDTLGDVLATCAHCHIALRNP
jgi:hypothetical protein